MVASIIKRTARVVVAAIVAFCAGCTGAILNPGQATRVIDASGGLETADLPQREATKVCLTTASKMESAGHTREAILLYEKARQNDPSLGTLAHRLALLYDRSGDADRAQREFELAVKEDGNNAALWNDYGFFQLRQGSVRAAESSLQKALELDPSERRAAVNLATLYAQTGREQESLELFTGVVGEAAACSNLGVILAKQGQTAKAEQYLQRASAMDASLAQPKAFLSHFAKAGRASPDASGDAEK